MYYDTSLPISTQLTFPGCCRPRTYCSKSHTSRSERLGTQCIRQGSFLFSQPYGPLPSPEKTSPLRSFALLREPFRRFRTLAFCILAVHLGEPWGDHDGGSSEDVYCLVGQSVGAKTCRRTLCALRCHRGRLAFFSIFPNWAFKYTHSSEAAAQKYNSSLTHKFLSFLPLYLADLSFCVIVRVVCEIFLVYSEYLAICITSFQSFLPL